MKSYPKYKPRTKSEMLQAEQRLSCLIREVQKPPTSIGPGLSDFERGMISGKLSALRWVLGMSGGPNEQI